MNMAPLLGTCSTRYLALLCCALALTAHSQSTTLPGATADRARATADRVTPVASAATAVPASPIAAAPKLASDAEYGEQVVLARRANWEPWAFTADAEYYLTDNVGLASVGELQDTYLRTGLQARYTNRIHGNWFANAGLDGHALFYDTFDALNFLLVKADAGALYRVPWLADTFLSAGYTGYWISESDLATEAFRNHALALGAQKVWKISRGMQFVAGASAEYSVNAEPVTPQRQEYSAYFGYKLRLTEHLSLSASYRLARYEYASFDRQDWNQVGLIGVTYDITDWAKVSLSTSAAWNRSNIPFYEYENLIGGTSLSFTLAF